MWFKYKKHSSSVQAPGRLGEKLKKTSTKKISTKSFIWPSMVRCSFRQSRTSAKLKGAPTGYTASSIQSVAPLTLRKPLPVIPPAPTASCYPRAIRCGTSVISLIRSSTIVPVAATPNFSCGAVKRPASSSHLPEPYHSEPRIKAARMTAVLESDYDSVYMESEEEENIYDEIIPTSSTPIRVNRKRCIGKRVEHPPSPLLRPHTVFQRSPYLDLMQVSNMTFSISPERRCGRPVTALAQYSLDALSAESNVYALHGEQTYRSSCLSIYDQVASDSSDAEMNEYEFDEIYGWSDEEVEDKDVCPTAAFGQCIHSQLYSPVAGVPRSSGLKWMRRESYIVQ